MRQPVVFVRGDGVHGAVRMVGRGMAADPVGAAVGTRVGGTVAGGGAVGAAVGARVGTAVGGAGVDGGAAAGAHALRPSTVAMISQRPSMQLARSLSPANERLAPCLGYPSAHGPFERERLARGAGQRACGAGRWGGAQPGVAARP